MSTAPLVDAHVHLVRRIAIIGCALNALAVTAMLLAYPTDPRPQVIDIFEEAVFLAGGIAAIWVAWKTDAPGLMAGAVILTSSLAIEVADEFVIEQPVVGDYLPASLAGIGMSMVAWGLGRLAASERQVRMRLQSSEHRFQSLFDLCPIPLAVNTLEGKFVAVNAAFEKTYGYRREMIVGEKPSAVGFFPAEVGRAFVDRLQEKRDAPVRQTVQVQTRMGTARMVSLIGESVRLAEGPVIISAMYDVTDQSTLLREIERYQGQLEVAAMKDEFIATMSHKLKSPLTRILGSSDPALIKTNAEHLLAIIDDIIELSRLEGGRAPLQREPVKVAAACDQAWQTVAARAHAKWLEAAVNVDKSVDTLFTDPRRLNQILVNLLDNAVKFTPPGGRIGMEVTADSPRGVVTFAVWDTGPGISPNDQSKLFHPFVQLRESSAGDETSTGTGLGLTLVRRTARALGGDVHLQSAPGAGSRFTVTLPLNPPATAELTA